MLITFANIPLRVTFHTHPPLVSSLAEWSALYPAPLDVGYPTDVATSRGDSTNSTGCLTNCFIFHSGANRGKIAYLFCSTI